MLTRKSFFYLLIFYSFYHNEIHPLTNYKAIKNKTNKTSQHRIKNDFGTNKTKQKKQIKKKMKLLAPAPLTFHFEQNINQSYDQ